MVVIRDDDLYEITLEKRSDAKLVISFAGIGFAMGGIQRHEFARSLRDQAIANSVCHVVDRSRSWYNRDTAAVAEALQRAAEGHDQVVTLGNSMGGFGAIYFAGIIPGCNRAIAFCPQFSVVPGEIVPPDRRWDPFTENISEWHARTALDHATSEVRYYLFYGASDGVDARHAVRFVTHGPGSLEVVRVAGVGHEVAAALRDRGELAPLLDALINLDGGPERLDAVMPEGAERVGGGVGSESSGHAGARRNLRRWLGRR